ncbi:uncharacterized protein LAESUDRAFT_416755 [Laetiporus sulphureus 93-53]|uniref:NAD(P)-binding domain-containing protein n=1 Tax=Laetiporus sulphureus 93-53 TaxID=1314785 RepID=A0A165GEF4_9APHY|nr:uncharacterized protein LAESUDRAFT_416755 [Laetiporus sulphureus 93-53]KZT10235.1 hypothetical protein LAESUDRAFT_416755 [Laetiporus sulphureus 93-53]
MRLLLTGVTGVDPSITRITLLSRRPIPPWAVLPSDASSKTTLIQHDDFTKYPPEVARQLAENDACIWALGRSAIGMNEEDYTRMTHTFTMSAVRALKEAGVGEGREEGKPFRFVFISGGLADQTEKSWMMWARVKGRTEKDLVEFCKASPNMKAYVYRPGYFFPSAKYPEDRKNQRSATANVVDCTVTPIYDLLAPSAYSPIEDLGRFSVELAKGRWPDGELFRNKDMIRLMKEL